MNGDELVMPIWLMAALAVLVGAEFGIRLISRRPMRLGVYRFRNVPLAAAGALVWVHIGPGPSTLRMLTAGSSLALFALSQWWFASGGGPVAMYRRALRRNAQVLPPKERAPGVVAWLVVALTVASVALLTATATQCSLFRP